MIEEILDTEAKVKIMKFLSRFPDTQFQAIDIANRVELSASRTSECLKALAEKGILESKKIGKGYLFAVNKSNYLTRIILDLFIKEKKLVVLIANEFVSRIKDIDKIKSIVLFGSALKELKIGSDIDFFIVSGGAIDRDAISKIEAELDEKYGFPVSSVVMTVSELKRKTKTGENFIISLIASGKTIFGKDLEEIVYGKKS